MKPGITDILSIEPHPYKADRWDVCVWMVDGTKIIVGSCMTFDEATPMHDNLYIFIRHIMATVEDDTMADVMRQVREVLNDYSPGVRFRQRPPSPRPLREGR